MPDHGRAERIAFLRTAIARIETGGGGGADAHKLALKPGTGQETGFSAPRAGFFEAGPASAGDSGAACGFALALAGLLARLSRKPVLWVAEDFVLAERGLPWPPGMNSYGVNGFGASGLGANHNGARQMVLMRAGERIDLFRMMEEALRAKSFALVIGEPAALSGENLPKLMRRIAVASRLHQSPALLLRPPMQDGRAAPFLAPKSMRFQIAAAPSTEPGERQTPAPVLQAPRWRIMQRDEQDCSFETGPLMQGRDAQFWRGLGQKAFAHTAFLQEPAAQDILPHPAQNHAALSVNQPAAA